MPWILKEPFAFLCIETGIDFHGAEDGACSTLLTELYTVHVFLVCSHRDWPPDLAIGCQRSGDSVTQRADSRRHSSWRFA